MLSAPAAAELLAHVDSVPRLCRIAAVLGFTAAPQRLDPELHERLGLPPDIDHARLITGEGALRALVVQLGKSTTTREALVRIARALAAHAPHCMWIVFGCTADGAASFLAAWTARSGGTGVRALLVDRHHVYAADTETLAALAASRGGPDILTHTRWVEILGRDSITRRFYADLARTVRDLAQDLTERVPPAARAEMALLNVSRLLFLAFVQTRGWLDGDYAFLQNSFDRGVGSGGNLHRRMLEPLFFGTLNTRISARQSRARTFGRIPYLNGGLFSRTSVEKTFRHTGFSDAALGRVFGDLLARYRFTPHEEQSDWSDTAVDPVILGRAFESLMEQRARKDSGSYYTPAPVVERATVAVLEHLLDAAGLSAALHAIAGGETPAVREARELLLRIRDIRLLDPACGSGAFLVHALRVLAELRASLSREPRATARAAVLASSIYGIDVNPTAVWLCQLRLWLCLAVEYDAAAATDVPPLPNLDRNVRVGDSLAGASVQAIGIERQVAAELAKVRARYVRAHGARKRTLARRLDVLERRSAIAAVDARLSAVHERRREMLAALRSPDLFGGRGRCSTVNPAEVRRLRLEARQARLERARLKAGAALPFSVDVQFADVMEAGGFDVIVGNPPWVRPHRLTQHARGALRAHFAVCRAPDDARAPAFGAQIDLAAPFVERSLALLRPGGALALLLPAKLWRSVAGAALRRHLLRAANLIGIEDYSEAERMFDAATYPSLLVAARATSEVERVSGVTQEVRITIQRRSRSLAWESSRASLPLEKEDSSPWLLVPPAVRRAFDALTRAGTPLGGTSFGAPRLGVKTGCNRAFIVSARTTGQALVAVSSGEVHGWVEHTLLRPALRGELVRAWNASAEAREFIVWTHDRRDRPLAKLPPHAGRWLRQWRQTLAARTDARASHVWWRLFRTPAARNDAHRVVWCDIGRTPRSLVLAPGDPVVPINTCYVTFAGERGAWALCALLNGPLATAWLNVLAEPARGGYRRYFGWTVSMLPLPADERRFIEIMAPLGLAAAGGTAVSQRELLEGAVAAYGLRQHDIAPLIEWQDA